MFDKQRDRFDVATKTALIQLAIPRTSGVYFAPRPKQEKLYFNLLRVHQLSAYIYTTRTATEDESKAYSALQKIGLALKQKWLLKEKFVLSFHDLRQTPCLLRITKACENPKLM